MIIPDTRVICESLLYATGFRTAKALAGRLVRVFNFCTTGLQ